MKTVIIHTDGACSGNTKQGGWAAIILDGSREKVLSDGEPDTTNNRMELTGVIRALEALDEPSIVELYSDSKYVIDGLRKDRPEDRKARAEGWKDRGWVRSGGKKAKNPDLWERLLELCRKHEVSPNWEKGHDPKNPYNIRCDKMAKMAAAKSGKHE